MKSFAKLICVFGVTTSAVMAAYAVNKSGVYGVYAVLGVLLLATLLLIFGLWPKGMMVRLPFGVALVFLGAMIILNAWPHLGSLQAFLDGFFRREAVFTEHASTIVAGLVFFSGGLAHASLHISDLIDRRYPKTS